MQAYRLILLAGALGVALMTTACSSSSDGIDLTTPSQLNTTKLQVQDQPVTEMVSTAYVDLPRVAALAQDIKRRGSDGAVTMTVPYLAAGYQTAVGIGLGYRQAFVAQGVQIAVAFVQIAPGAGTADKAGVSYHVVVATQPDCSRIPGRQGGETLKDIGEYPFGCETQGQLGKMVADPNDLLGAAQQQDNDSRRSGAVIEPYKAGTPNQPIKGMQASQVGQ